MTPQQPHTLPDGWEMKRLGDIATFYNGRAYRLTEWEKSGTPVIRLQNLTGSGEKYYYSNLRLPAHQYCERGDLLYMWSASFGPCYWLGDKAIYHYHIWKVVENNLVASKSFLYYLLDFITEEMRAKSTNGMGLLHVTKGSMERMLVKIPEVILQRRIAAVLGTWDRAIEQHTDLLRAIRVRHRALTHRLLTGKVRLPGYAGEWREVKLGEVFTERSQCGHNHLPLLSITAEQGVVYRDSLSKKDSSNEDKSKYKRIRPGDIGYNGMVVLNRTVFLRNFDYHGKS